MPLSINIVEVPGALLLFSVNSARLRTVALSFAIACLAVWRCERGVDWAAFAADEGRVFLCEVAIGGPVYSYGARVVAIACFPAARAVAENGEGGLANGL
jgi:hypothetical protein